MSIAQIESVIRFAGLAKKYCDLLEARPLSRKRLLYEAGEILPELLAAVLKLPVGRENKRIGKELRERSDELGDTLWNLPIKRKRSNYRRYDHTVVTVKQFFVIDKRLRKILGEYDLYRKIFEPYRGLYPIMTSLANDLAEIWHDVKPSLLLFQTGEEAAMRHAVHRWTLDARIHWCKSHCPDALKVIYYALTDSDDYWDTPHLAPKHAPRRRKKK